MLAGEKCSAIFHLANLCPVPLVVGGGAPQEGKSAARGIILKACFRFQVSGSTLQGPNAYRPWPVNPLLFDCPGIDPQCPDSEKWERET